MPWTELSVEIRYIKVLSFIFGDVFPTAFSSNVANSDWAISIFTIFAAPHFSYVFFGICLGQTRNMANTTALPTSVWVSLFHNYPRLGGNNTLEFTEQCKNYLSIIVLF